MPRIMSCAETVGVVRNETKTVTRRLGWWKDRKGRRILHAGDELSLVRKAMGRKPGEPLERLALVEVVNVRRELLYEVTDEDVRREGVVDQVLDWCEEREIMGPLRCLFVEWYAHTFGCGPDESVTRIEWRYLHPVGKRIYDLGNRRGLTWDDGIVRPTSLIPDHLRHEHSVDAMQ